MREKEERALLWQRGATCPPLATLTPAAAAVTRSRNSLSTDFDGVRSTETPLKIAVTDNSDRRTSLHSWSAEQNGRPSPSTNGLPHSWSPVSAPSSITGRPTSGQAGSGQVGSGQVGSGQVGGPAIVAKPSIKAELASHRGVSPVGGAEISRETVLKTMRQRNSIGNVGTRWPERSTGGADDTQVTLS